MMSWHHIQQITKTVVKRIPIQVVADLAGWCVGNQAVHGFFRGSTINVSPGVGVPAEVPTDRDPAEATNELERVAVNYCRLALR